MMAIIVESGTMKRSMLINGKRLQMEGANLILRKYSVKTIYIGNIFMTSVYILQSTRKEQVTLLINNNSLNTL
jgi:hypothetical protein